MLNTQLVQEIEKLPLKDRLTLLEFLAHSVQKEIRENAGKPGQSLLPRVLGALKPTAGLPPDDHMLKEEYAEYLIQKYS